MTTTNIVVRRGEDYFTVSVSADVKLGGVDVAFDGLTYRDAFEEVAGLFPLSAREHDMAERALEDEAVEERRDALEDARESCWEREDCR